MALEGMGFSRDKQGESLDDSLQGTSGKVNRKSAPSRPRNLTTTANEQSLDGLRSVLGSTSNSWRNSKEVFLIRAIFRHLPPNRGRERCIRHSPDT
jgi:hypothetical protein